LLETRPRLPLRISRAVRARDSRAREPDSPRHPRRRRRTPALRPPPGGDL